MKTHATRTGRAWSWDALAGAGIECFRASGIVHHFGRHSHETYAIGVFEKGVGGVDWRGASDYILAGDIVVMNPDEPHTGYSAGDRPMSYRMLYLGADALGWLLPERSRLPVFRDLHIRSQYWAARLARLHRVLETSPEPLEQEASLHEILTPFVGACGGSALRERAADEPCAIRRVKEYLRANYRRNVSADELAAVARLSRAYLIRAFKAAVGIPPHAWLLQVRIEEAKRLLARGAPIGYVAYEVGFADQGHLTRRFKSVTGMTPGQYVAGRWRPRSDA